MRKRYRRGCRQRFVQRLLEGHQRRLQLAGRRCDAHASQPALFENGGRPSCHLHCYRAVLGGLAPPRTHGNSDARRHRSVWRREARHREPGAHWSRLLSLSRTPHRRCRLPRFLCAIIVPACAQVRRGRFRCIYDEKSSNCVTRGSRSERKRRARVDRECRGHGGSLRRRESWGVGLPAGLASSVTTRVGARRRGPLRKRWRLTALCEH